MLNSKKVIDRYRELKHEAQDCVLLMQVGIFMQVLDKDAEIVSEITGIKLRMTGEVDSPVVVGGFPMSGLDAYTGRLVRAGRSVAIAFQDEQKERYIRELVRVGS